MKIGSSVVLKEAVIVAASLVGTDLLPKGTRGVVRAERGNLLSLSVDGVLYPDIPAASVDEVRECGAE